MSTEKAFHFTNRSKVDWVGDLGLNNSENVNVYFMIKRVKLHMVYFVGARTKIISLTNLILKVDENLNCFLLKY